MLPRPAGDSSVTFGWIWSRRATQETPPGANTTVDLGRGRGVLSVKCVSGWQTERVPDEQALIRPARIDDDEHVWPLARDFATSFRPQRAAFDAARDADRARFVSASVPLRASRKHDWQT